MSVIESVLGIAGSTYLGKELISVGREAFFMVYGPSLKEKRRR